MARPDMDIKADVIAELEDVHALHAAQSVLDALMVEELKVDHGLVSLTLIFPDERLASDEPPLRSELERALRDIEGVQGVLVSAMSRAELKAREPSTWLTAQNFPPTTRAPASSPDAPKGPKSEGGLTLNALLKGAGCGDDDALDALLDEEPAEEPAAPLSLYSGGGCAVGNTQITLSAVDKARQEARQPLPPPPTPLAPPAAPPPPVLLAPPPRPAPLPPPPILAPPPPDAPPASALLVIERDVYARLLAAERELALRPRFEEHQALQVRVQVLEAKIRALRHTLQGLFSDLE